MIRAAAVAVAALLVFVLAPLALADGVVLPSRAIVKPVRTPDQRALVAFDGTTETLVVETTLQGEGTDFAWIVPLPASPRVEASTTGLFPTLEVVTAPRVVERHKVAPGWLLPAFFGACVLGAWVATRRTPGAVGMGVGVPVAIGFVLATHVSCAQSAGHESPREVARALVGAFDVATVDPGDGSGLRGWLDTNGFAAPPAVDAVAADYAKRGWVFVAAKLRTDASEAVRHVHPLAFTFPATEAVYPMRLTLAANPSCAVELFAFGAGTAAAPGLVVEYSGPWHGTEWDVAKPDPEIARFVSDRPVTKLTATLHPANCTDDLALRFEPFREVRPELLTVAAAADRANTVAAWTALLGGFFVSIAIGSWRRGPSNVAPRVRVVAYAAVALVAGVVCFATWSAAEIVPNDAVRVYADGGKYGK